MFVLFPAFDPLHGQIHKDTERVIERQEETFARSRSEYIYSSLSWIARTISKLIICTRRGILFQGYCNSGVIQCLSSFAMTFSQNQMFHFQYFKHTIERNITDGPKQPNTSIHMNLSYMDKDNLKE